MKKILIFSDIQYRHYLRVGDSQVNWLDVQLNATEQVFEIAKKHSIKHIIHNGDLFEQKNKIDVSLYNRIWNYFKNKVDEGFNLFFNLGNHDIMSTRYDTSLQPFSTFATIIKHPTDINIDGISTRIVPYGLTEEIDIYDAGCDILFLHEMIDGLKSGPKDYLIDTDIKPKDLSKWKYVFNGHIHKPQQIGNIINIGSLIQQDFGEANEEKRIILLADDFSITSVPIVGPKFYTNISLSQKDKVKEYSDELKFFRFDISEEEINDPIFDMPNVSYKIVKRKEREFRFKTDISEGDEVKEYVKKFNDSELLTNKLIKIGKRIIRESKN